MINYNGRRFRPVENSAAGEVSGATIFYYRQSGQVVWGEYSGGEVVRGHIMAIADDDGALDMRYHHVNTSGKIVAGVCRSTPHVLADGRLRLDEEWQWTSGRTDSGTSVLVEIPNLE